MWRSMASTITGLTPAVGSSSSTSRGRPMSTVANSSSFCWPNDSSDARFAGHVRQAELGEDLLGPRAVRRPDVQPERPPVGLLDRRGEVLDHGHPREHPRLLERPGQPLPGQARRVRPADRVPPEPHRPRVGRDDTR